MANILSNLKTHLPHVADRKGLGGYAVDKVERYGASLGFGFLKGYYREKASIKGVPVEAIVGGGAVLGSVILEIMSGGRSSLAPHLNAIGDAGLQSYLNSIGASMGAKKSGRKVYVLDAGAAAPKTLPPGMVAVGALPQAVAGAGQYLTQEQIARYADQR